MATKIEGEMSFWEFFTKTVFTKQLGDDSTKHANNYASLNIIETRKKT